MHLTEEQIIKLAPDAASEKAGKGLASPAKWVLREYSERALWGHCQGSGKNPYQTQIDLQNIAFKCSCPSRKFPCKHGLGLLLLHASHPELFHRTDEPEWVKAWLEKRSENAEKKEKRAQEKANKPVDEKARQRRVNERVRKVNDGVEELQIRLKDILRNGLLNIPEKIYTLASEMRRRLIDAQAPGLAAMVSELMTIDFETEVWKYDLTDALSRIYLLAESYKHIDTLTPEWQEEVKSLVGFTQAKEEILSGSPITDTWMVLYVREEKQDKITVQYHWLYGKSSGRYVLYLQFLAPGVVPEVTLLSGSFISADMYFYPGVSSQRVLFKQYTVSQDVFAPQACASVAEAMAMFREIVTHNPFVTKIPVIVAHLRLTRQEDELYAMDTDKHTVPLHLTEKARAQLLLITGGKPFAAFLFADAKRWSIKTIWVEQHYHILDNEDDE